MSISLRSTNKLTGASLGIFSDAIAIKYGKTPAQVFLRWDLQHGVVPLPKAYREDHQRQNIALFDFELDTGDMAVLDSLNEQFSALDKLEYL